MSEQDELVQAAIAWYRSCGPYGPAGPYSDEMSHLLGAIERVMPPEPEERPWSQVPAGWSVQHPTDGTWWEIESTQRADDGRQEVTFRNPKGRSLRPADKLVTCRPPATPDATDAALSAFGDGFEIMEDQIS